MRIPSLLKTKTFWSGVALVVYGAINRDWEAFLAGLSFIFLRDAVNKVNNGKGPSS